MQEWGIKNIEGFSGFDDIMIVEDWIINVSQGMFNDYDGFGEQVLYDGIKYTVGPEIYPSEVTNLDPNCSHIIWYNR